MNDVPCLSHSYHGETIRSGELAGVRFTVSRYRSGQVLPVHEHDAATVCYVVSGSFEEHSDRVGLECSKGDCLFRPAGRAHSDRFIGERTTTFALDLPASMAQYGASDLTRVRSSKTSRLIRRIFEEALRPDAYSDLAVEGLLSTLQGEIALAPDDGQLRPPAWLRRVHARLKDDPASIPTLQELAAILGEKQLAQHTEKSNEELSGCICRPPPRAPALLAVV